MGEGGVSINKNARFRKRQKRLMMLPCANRSVYKLKRLTLKITAEKHTNKWFSLSSVNVTLCEVI